MKKNVFLILVIMLLCGYSSVFAYHFFDGTDWNKIHFYRLPPSQETKLKIMYLKTLFEVSVFNASPILTINATPTDFLATYNKDFLVYNGIIDRFYSKPENEKFPLFFTLKIADMIKNGAPDTDIASYMNKVITELKAKGLME